MSKIKIVHGSETGNTESIADALAGHLKGLGHEVDCASAAKTPAKGLADGFDCVLMGASVWGTDEIELQSDFSDYEGNFGDMGLSGKKCAAFASGDTSYELFCGAVDFIEGEYKKVNADIITDGLRVDGDASDAADEIKAFAETISKAL